MFAYIRFILCSYVCLFLIREAKQSSIGQHGPINSSQEANANETFICILATLLKTENVLAPIDVVAELVCVCVCVRLCENQGRA